MKLAEKLLSIIEDSKFNIGTKVKFKSNAMASTKFPSRLLGELSGLTKLPELDKIKSDSSNKAGSSGQIVGVHKWESGILNYVVKTSKGYSIVSSSSLEVK